MYSISKNLVQNTARLVCLAVLVLSLLLSLVDIINAQAYRGIILNKFRFDFEQVEPGTTISDTFTVTYDFQPLEDGSYKSVVVYPLPKNFSQSLDGGAQILKDDALPITADLASWMEFESDSYLLNQPEQKVAVNFKIKVPIDAEPGGKYAIAFMANNSGDSAVEDAQSGDVLAGLNSAGGPLIFLTIKGENTKQLDLVDIYTTNIKGKKHNFFLNPPVNVVVEIRNTGNVHAVPRGRVYVHKSKNFVADNLLSVDLNNTGKVVLPGATRQFIIPWDSSFIKTEKVIIRGDKAKDIRLEPGEVGYDDYLVIDTEYKTVLDWDNLSKLRFGKYKATAQFNYNDANGIVTNTIEVNTTFYIIPLILLIILIILLVLITLFILFKQSKKEKK